MEGGDWLRNRFPWKTSLGLNENRTGHLNDVWGYWSTDGERPLARLPPVILTPP